MNPMQFSFGLRERNQCYSRDSNQIFKEQFQQSASVNPFLFSENIVLQLRVIGTEQYDFDENYVFELFSQFGKVLKVNKINPQQAYVFFKNQEEAVSAQNYLHGYCFRDIGVKLEVSICSGRVLHPHPKEQFSTPDSKKKTEFLREVGSKHLESVSIKNSSSNIPINFSPAFDNSPKYCCKYYICASDDNIFQIHKKIIGFKGHNIRKIVEGCRKNTTSKIELMNDDFLKIRLKGQGSGHLERGTDKEEDEKLHLFLSSKCLEVYQTACILIEELLNNLYEEYLRYCKITGHQPHLPLEIQRTEWISSRKPHQMTKNKMYEQGVPLIIVKRADQENYRDQRQIIIQAQTDPQYPHSIANIKMEDSNQNDCLNIKQEALI